MAERINGSVEIIRGTESIGVVGSNWLDTEVPVVLRNLHGITGMVTVTPQKQRTGRTPAFQWTAKTANNQDVVVLLWESRG